MIYAEPFPTAEAISNAAEFVSRYGQTPRALYVSPKIYQRTIKRVTCKLFLPNHKPIVKKWRAPAGQQFPQAVVDRIVENLIEDLDKSFPREDFRMVQIGPTEFNFVYAGLRDPSMTPERAEQIASVSGVAN
jgi:hypothetical protein